MLTVMEKWKKREAEKNRNLKQIQISRRKITFPTHPQTQIVINGNKIKCSLEIKRVLKHTLRI
jgi:hypothetical protein